MLRKSRNKACFQ